MRRFTIKIQSAWLLLLMIFLAPAVIHADARQQPSAQEVSPDITLPSPMGPRNAEGIAKPSAPGAGPISRGNPPSHSPDGAMADIHDIKPIIAPNTFPWLALWIAVAALALIALFWLGRHFWRKRGDGGEIPILRPELPPEENARLALNALAGERLVDGRRFYFRLSEILRRYLFERYRIGAPEMTPEELQPLVARLGLPAGQLGVLNTLWSRSEPIKFAGQAALETDMADDLEQVRRFVAVTTEAEAARLAEAVATVQHRGDPPPSPPPTPDRLES